MRKPILATVLAFSLPFTAHMTESVIPQETIQKANIRMDLEEKVNTTLKYNVLSHIPVCSPLKSAQINRISDFFGPRKRHPILKVPTFHSGIDFSAVSGTPVLATANGVVVDVDHSTKKVGYGNRIVIEHDNEYRTVYAHLQDINVSKGDTIIVGQEIGTVGTTGLSTGPHLHYEILHNRQAIDPLNLYQIDLEKEDIAKQYLAFLSDFESVIDFNS
jgi:murein DD-endopeptidase MepM/ murein hydrolase activator NlpD